MDNYKKERGVIFIKLRLLKGNLMVLKHNIKIMRNEDSKRLKRILKNRIDLLYILYKEWNFWVLLKDQKLTNELRWHGSLIQDIGWLEILNYLIKILVYRPKETMKLIYTNFSNV